jgi:uncharacterized protein with von Willebrand factor type A (vWA) domain
MSLELKKGDHIIVAVDTSGSMGETDPACGGQRKYQWMEETLLSYVKAAEAFDANGISVHFFSTHVEAYQNVADPGKVKQLFERHQPGGSTNTELVVQSAYAEHKQRASTSTFLLVFTDGDATDRASLKRSIVTITKQLANPEEFRILFLPIGTPDASLQGFLDDLDENLGKEGAVYDIVGVISPTEVDFAGAIADAIGSTTDAVDVSEGHAAQGKVTPHLQP